MCLEVGIFLVNWTYSGESIPRPQGEMLSWLNAALYCNCLTDSLSSFEAEQQFHNEQRTFDATEKTKTEADR